MHWNKWGPQWVEQESFLSFFRVQDVSIHSDITKSIIVIEQFLEVGMFCVGFFNNHDCILCVLQNCGII